MAGRLMDTVIGFRPYIRAEGQKMLDAFLRKTGTAEEPLKCWMTWMDLAFVLDALAAKGRDLRLILPASIDAQDKQDVAFLQRHGCQVRLMPVKPLYMHAKMIVGSSLAFIGSENFTETSLRANREVGILLRGSAIPTLQAQFDRDWGRADG